MARVAVHAAPDAKVVLQALLEPVGICFVVKAAKSPLHALELQHLQVWGKEEGCVWAGEECKERGLGKNAKSVGWGRMQRGSKGSSYASLERPWRGL